MAKLKKMDVSKLKHEDVEVNLSSGGVASVAVYDLKALFRLWSRHQTQISQKQHNMYTTAT